MEGVSVYSVRRLSRIATFIGWHVLVALGIWLFPPAAFDWVLCAIVYAIGMFAVTAGYHRYFSHKSYRTSRVGQLFLAVLAQMSIQKGVLWWASRHRHHHRFSDAAEDLHSPVQHGLFHAHLGWVSSHESLARDDARIPDLLAFPELRWLDRWYLVPPAALACGMWLAGGTAALVWGFGVPLLLVQHATSTINSLSHVWGTRPYPTPDSSRNNALLALITFGEGWHNNHHHHQSSARQGFLWWELDVTWLVLRLLASVGLVWDLRTPNARVLGQRQSRVLRRAAATEAAAARACRCAEGAVVAARDRLAAASRALELARAAELR